MNQVEFVKDKNLYKIVASAANITAAEVTRTKLQSGTKKPVEPNRVATIVIRAADSPKLSRAKILWVNDNPDNNIYERNALGVLGIHFCLATDTKEALKYLKETKFNLIISDFKLKDDPQGGYRLLAEIKKLPSPPPFIIYSYSANPEFEKDAKVRGAYGETNSPQRLFELSVNAIQEK